MPTNLEVAIDRARCQHYAAIRRKHRVDAIAARIEPTGILYFTFMFSQGTYAFDYKSRTFQRLVYSATVNDDVVDQILDWLEAEST